MLEEKDRLIEELVNHPETLLYYGGTSIEIPDSCLVVDWDVTHLHESKGKNKELILLEQLQNKFQRVVINQRRYVPNLLIESEILDARKLLNDDGEMLFVLPPRQSHRRFAKFLKKCFENVKQINTKPRIFWATKPILNGVDSIEKEIKISGQVSGYSLDLLTRLGIFSYSKFDKGTCFLLENIFSKFKGKSVLDWGCGYGLIGIVATLSGAASVTMIDKDLRSLTCTRKNLNSLGLQASTYLTDTCLNLPETFDICVSNPPTHLGLDMLKSFFSHSVQKLKPGGGGYFVIHNHLNVEKWLDSFGSWDIYAQNEEYKIIVLDRCG